MSFYEFLSIVAALIGAMGTALQAFFSYDTWKAQKERSVPASQENTVTNQAPRRSIFQSKFLWVFIFGTATFLGQFAFAEKTPEQAGITSVSTSSAPQPVRLSVVGLAANPPSESAFFQIKVIVNGKVFTLPSNGGWMPAQSVIRNQSVVLPPLSQYAIQFQIRKRDAYFANATPATLRGNATVRYPGGPASGTYLLKGFDSTSPTGGSTISATVAYSLAPAR